MVEIELFYQNSELEMSGFAYDTLRDLPLGVLRDGFSIENEVIARIGEGFKAPVLNLLDRKLTPIFESEGWKAAVSSARYFAEK